MSLKKTSSQTSINKTIGGAAASTPNIYLIAPNSVNQYANGSLITAGGPSVTVANVFVTNSTYGVIDDTAISTAGGYVKITGTGFTSGCVAYMDGETSISTTFVNSTEIRAQFGAITSGNTHVYVINPDNSVGIKLNAIVSSGVPAWTTTTPLTDQLFDISFQLNFVATSDSNVSYYVSAGNSLPSGTTLAANGLFSGTVATAGANNDTTYSFSVDAIDAENQETPRTFSITLRLGDTNFYNMPMLLTGTSNTWFGDYSNTKIVTSVTSSLAGNTLPTGFNPYSTEWSGYFDGTGDFLSGTCGALGAGDFTVEFWSCQPFATGRMYYFSIGSSPDWGDANGVQLLEYDGFFAMSCGGVNSITVRAAPTRGEWVHVAVVRYNGVVTLYYNGVAASTTLSTTTNLTGTLYRIGSGSVNSGSWLTYAGFMSNFRIVAGTAVYTAGFTPPTTDLTAVTNTRLLTLIDNRFIDKSGNTSTTVVRNGDVNVRPIGPFTDTENSSGSVYFDGSGDYVNLTSNAAYTLGTSDHCIEFWLYMDGSQGSYATHWDYGVNAATFATNKYYFTMGSAGTGDSNFLLGNGSGAWAFNITGTGDHAKYLNQWVHVVMTRQSNVFRLFFNGNMRGSASYSGSITAQNQGMCLSYDGGTGYSKGYFSHFRLIKGSVPTQYQTSNTTANSVIFTPPTSPVAYDANTVVQVFDSRIGENNHRFIETSAYRGPVYRAGNATMGSVSPFSPAGWSQYTDGTSDYTNWSKSLSLAGDWSLEMWFFYPYSPGAMRGLFCLGATASYGLIQIRLDENVGLAYEENAIHFCISLNGGTWNDRYSVSNAFQKGRWHHLVWTRQSNNLRGFIDGKLLHTTRVLSGTMTGSTHRIGTMNDGSLSFPGYISNVRLQNGNIPTSYQTSSNTANAQIFTPPTTPLTANSTTDLLLCASSRFVDLSPTPATLSSITGDNTRTINISPFKASGTGYNPVTHGGSAYFDGTTDGVIVPDNPYVEFTSGDFCIECMIYPKSTSLNGVLIDKRSGSYGPVLIWRNGANIVAYMSSTNSSWNMVNTITIGTVTNNQWYHVALYRVGAVIYGSVNGVIVQCNASASGLVAHNNAGNWYIGSGTNGSDVFTGYIAGMKVTQGPHSYTGSSCPIPTTPLARDKYTRLLLEFNNGGIIDPTTRTLSEAYGDARITNIRGKFGSTSITLDGTGDYLVVQPHPSIALRAGITMTIEAWIYPSTVAPTTSSCVIGDTVISGTSLYWLVGFAVGNFKPYIQWNDGATKSCTATNALTTNAWSHVAWVITAGVITMYINGVAETLTGTTTLTTPTSTVGYLSIGNDRGNTWAGSINDLRITSSARYTGNFAAPTSPAINR